MGSPRSGGQSFQLSRVCTGNISNTRKSVMYQQRVRWVLTDFEVSGDLMKHSRIYINLLIWNTLSRASTIRNETFNVANEIVYPTLKRVGQVVIVSRCLVYIIMKHVAYIGSCVAADKISTIARPTRK